MHLGIEDIAIKHLSHYVTNCYFSCEFFDDAILNDIRLATSAEPKPKNNRIELTEIIEANH